MIIPLLYLGALCFFTEGSRAQENKIGDLKYEVDGSKRQEASKFQQSNFNVVERGFWSKKTDNQNLPYYYTSIMRSINNTDTRCRGDGFSCVTFPSQVIDYLERLGQTDPNKLGTFATTPAEDATLSTYRGATLHLNMNSNKLSAYFLKFNDPEWRKQWHMQDYRTKNIPVMDHNIVPVFNMGITGKGITVAILGDGILNHPDLGNSYDKELSFNFCYNERGASPDRLFSLTGGVYYDPDGTGNAGVIAMKAGNGICGVGIAPRVKIIGYRILGCESTSLQYKQYSRDELALIQQSDIIDIYCNVWLNYRWIGDKDANKLLKPSEKINDIFKNGAIEGRQNKGSIYIFPSGVKRAKNNCATNGYLNNPYVITVASANQGGKPASYSERCSAVFATTYSGDDGYEGIATISTNGQCSTYFTNLPASPAIASGIIALVLEANNSLTYRDVMHIITMSAEVAPLADNVDTWQRNGRGFWVSSDFGFGLLNAENMVMLAKNWKGIPNYNVCILRKKMHEPLYFDPALPREIILDGRTCTGARADITYLEHVQLEVSIDHVYRGDIYLDLTSPAGTTTRMMYPRRTDSSKMGYQGWNVMSVQNWGENPKGEWKVNVGADKIRGNEDASGNIHEIILKLQGTQSIPGNYPRKYAAFRLPNGRTNQYF